jgi:hypothetical protein
MKASRLHLLIRLALTPAMNALSLLQIASGGGDILVEMIWWVVVG